MSLQSGDLTWSGTVGSGVTETHEIVVEVLPAAVGQELVATADFDDGTDIWMRSVTSYGWTKYALPVVMREFVP